MSYDEARTFYEEWRKELHADSRHGMPDLGVSEDYPGLVKRSEELRAAEQGGADLGAPDYELLSALWEIETARRTLAKLSGMLVTESESGRLPVTDVAREEKR
jgi:hypothetical protein